MSGSTDPRERSGSGPWLRDRLHEFDVVVAQKLDRFGRSTRHVHGLFQYLTEHGKTMYTADGQISTTGPTSELVLFILSWAAQMELAAISERNANAAQHNIAAGKYRGGLCPAGYRAVKSDDGWKLEPDEDGLAPEIRSIVQRVLAGERLTAILADLNQRKVPTQRDRQDSLAGRQPKGREWTNSNLRRLLASPTLVGLAVAREKSQSNGKTVYGDEYTVLGPDGLPLQRAEPLISLTDYRALQNLLAERREAEPAQRRGNQKTLLVGVIVCGTCGRRMYRLKGGPGRQPRYRCSSVQVGPACGGPSVPTEAADRYVTTVLLSMVGELPYAERQLDRGEDYTEQLAKIDQQLESLGQAVTRFPAGSTALENLLANVDSLAARRAEIAARADRPAGYRYVVTGGTFADRWESLGPTGKNDLLRDNRVRLIWGPDGVDLDLGDIPGIVSAVNPELGERIREAGVGTFRELTGADPETGELWVAPQS